MRGRLDRVSTETDSTRSRELVNRLHVQVCGVSSESNVERSQELVHTRQEAFGSTLVSRATQRNRMAHSRAGVGLDRGLAVEDNDSVGKVRGHDLPSVRIGLFADTTARECAIRFRCVALLTRVDPKAS
jgi:hypothetical protein